MSSVTRRNSLLCSYPKRSMELVTSKPFLGVFIFREGDPQGMTSLEKDYLLSLIGTQQSLLGGKTLRLEKLIHTSDHTFVFEGVYDLREAIIKVTPRYLVRGPDYVSYLTEEALFVVAPEVEVELPSGMGDTPENWELLYREEIERLSPEQRVAFEKTYQELFLAKADARPFILPGTADYAVHSSIENSIQTVEERAVVPRLRNTQPGVPREQLRFDAINPLEYYIVEKLGDPIYKGFHSSVDRLARNVITALEVVHRVAIHRDVTPSNIVNTEGGFVLIDFGTAWHVHPGPVASSRDELVSLGEKDHPFEEFLGTPDYAPPIQYIGRWDRLGDLISLCYILDVAYIVEPLPWFGITERSNVFKAKLAFQPRNPRVKQFYEYLQSLPTDNVDYSKCRAFFE